MRSVNYNFRVGRNNILLKTTREMFGIRIPTLFTRRTKIYKVIRGATTKGGILKKDNEEKTKQEEKISTSFEKGRTR